MKTIDFRLNRPQLDFITATEQNIGFVAGLGSGKSFSATLKCILFALEHPTLSVAYYLPTYGLIRDISYEIFPELLDKMKLHYILNKSNKEIRLIGAGRIIFRSMDTPETIVGFEVALSIIDECDILPMEKMLVAYRKILSRNRQKRPDGEHNQMIIVGTPEGFRFFHDRYVKRFNPETDKLIKASTYQNRHLPDGYIDQLREQFSSELIEAYLNGTFVNMTSGTVITEFDRVRNNSNEEENGKEPLYIGMDFNVTNMSAVVGIWIENDIHIVEEITGIYDTPAMIRYITEVYGRGDNREIHIYPDASSSSRKTVDASTTDYKLLKDAKFKVHKNPANPRIKDRILTTNTNFYNARHQTRMYVNIEACPDLMEAIEQLVYDKNGMPDTSGKDLTHIIDALGYLSLGVLPIKLYSRKKNNFIPKSKYMQEDKSLLDGLSA